jgi:hypothetical protein
MLINCQMMDKGGSGYLGLVEFLPDGKTLQFKTYSPYLDKYLTDDEHQFTLDVPPPPSAHYSRGSRIMCAPAPDYALRA